MNTFVTVNHNWFLKINFWLIFQVKLRTYFGPEIAELKSPDEIVLFEAVCLNLSIARVQYVVE